MSDQLATRRSKIAVCAFTVVWIAVVIGLWLFGAQGAHENQLFTMTVIAYLACWAPLFAVSLHSRRRKTIRFVLASTPLLITLAVIELAVPMGLVDYRHVFGKRVVPWEDTRNLLDPELLHIHRPHLHQKGQTTGGDLSVFFNTPALTVRPYDLKYDRYGFRNEFDYDRADCVVIGDSLVEATGVFADELLTHHVADALEISVANLGQSYYGPQQELKVLQRFGVSLKPGICVWVFFEGNDLKDVWRYRQFVEQWPDNVANYSSWKQRSFTMNACTFLRTRFNAVAPSERRDIMGSISTSRGEQQLWFGYVGTKLTVRDVEALKITLATISDAHSLCKQRGIQLVVAFAPTKFRVYADVCRFEQGSSIQKWVVNPLPNVLSTSIRKISTDIGFLDLTTDLKQAAKGGQILYYPDDTHWSPEGHVVVAHTISQFLTSEYDELLRRESATPVR